MPAKAHWSPLLDEPPNKTPRAKRRVLTTLEGKCANLKDVLISRHNKKNIFSNLSDPKWLARCLNALTAHWSTCGESRVNPLDYVVHYCRLGMLVYNYFVNSSFDFNMFLFIFQSDLGGFCMIEPKCMFQLGRRCTFVNFVTFDVLMLMVFVRICLGAVSYRVLQLFVQTFFLFTAFSFSICAEGSTIELFHTPAVFDIRP